MTTTLATQAAVFLHRELFRDELHIGRLVSRQPPTQMDPNTGVLHQEPATRIGMNMSGSMLRRLGHPEGFGSMYPWTRALWLLRVECRRRHPHHRSGDRPYWRGSLCHQAVKLTIIGGETGNTGPLSVEAASRILRVDRIDAILKSSFRFIEDTMDDFRDRAERRAREDQGHGELVGVAVARHTHTALDGLHAVDCPQCRRNAA